jgi:hypothetical protein
MALGNFEKDGGRAKFAKNLRAWRPRDYGRSAISISGKPKFSLAHKIFILQGGEHLLGSKNNYLCSYVVQECHSGFLASFCQNFSEQAFRLDPSRDFWRQERKAKKNIHVFNKRKSCNRSKKKYNKKSVLRIRIWIHRIHMFLGLPDPDPSDRGVDPVNPSINKQKKLEKP